MRFLPYAVLIGFTLLAWGGVPWGTFQFDDYNNVVRDPATTDPTVLAGRLLHGLRPLTRLSYFADAKFYGLQAYGFLLTNLILHLITVLLVYELAKRRLTSTGACVAALFFALQPTNAEVVAYVSGRSSGLMTLLLLAGLLAYDRGKRAWAYIFFAMACLAKEVALIFPALILLWEMTTAEERADRKRNVVIPAMVAGAVCAALFTLANYRVMMGYSIGLRPPSENLLANGRAVPVMLSLWLRPWALSPDHDFDATGPLLESIAGLVVMAAVLAAAFFLRRRKPALALVMAWPLIALLPTNSVIPKIDLVTERALYLAWVGPSIGLGFITAAASSPAARRAIAVVLTALLCGLAGVSMWRASLWRHPVLLWQDAVAKAPQKSRCWNNLGMAFLNEKRDREAVEAFERAIALDPQNKIARSNLAIARLLCGTPCKQD